jgi:prepilin-type N-terminal cleavage/methylation domain-containing protein
MRLRALESGPCPAVPRGFTLIEMAVALFIITLLLGSLLVPLTTQVESRNYAETQRILEQAREALIGFAAANGYFPCPASAASNSGVETGANHTTGGCSATVIGSSNTFVGFLPAVTLGFTPTDSQGYAVDAWGLTQNRIRYAIYRDAALTSLFVRTNGMRSTGMSTIAGTTTMLYVCNSGTGVSASNCNTAGTLASSVPIVIWSVGANAATGGTSTDEAENLDNDRIFVWRPKGGGTAGDFDDIVTWLPTSLLFNRMIAAGQLP